MSSSLRQYQALGILCMEARESVQQDKVGELFLEVLKKGDLNAVCGIHCAHPEVLRSSRRKNLPTPMMTAITAGYADIVRYLRQQNIQVTSEDLHAITYHLDRAPRPPIVVYEAESRALELLKALMYGPHSATIEAQSTISTAIAMKASRFLVALLKHFPEQLQFAFLEACSFFQSSGQAELRPLLLSIRNNYTIDLSSPEKTLAFANIALPVNVMMSHDMTPLEVALSFDADKALLLSLARERGHDRAIKLLQKVVAEASAA